MRTSRMRTSRSAGGAIEKLQLKELPEPAKFFAEHAA
jgi:hypothetical protein